AQMSQYKFNQLFDQAFSQVLTGEYQEAIPMLEKLNNSDALHDQVSFLLAMCYLKTDQETAQAINLLEQSVRNYDAYHQFGRTEDRTAPYKAWFFLAEAYVKVGRFNDAIVTYRTYMTTVPWVSIDQKRVLVAKIASARKLKMAEAGLLAYRMVQIESQKQ
ncbi:MAG: tetratricopeptide repeat protein, partial [Flavobacteriales bacterium]|nr:tetratricopeptide repeat protein [Flavobacteriales bacterium]